MVDVETWANKTMAMINKLTPDIKGKAFDPEWFLLRQMIDFAQVALNAADARCVYEKDKKVSSLLRDLCFEAEAEFARLYEQKGVRDGK